MSILFLAGWSVGVITGILLARECFKWALRTPAERMVKPILQKQEGVEFFDSGSEGDDALEVKFKEAQERGEAVSLDEVL